MSAHPPKTNSLPSGDLQTYPGLARTLSREQELIVAFQNSRHPVPVVPMSSTLRPGGTTMFQSNFGLGMLAVETIVVGKKATKDVSTSKSQEVKNTEELENTGDWEWEISSKGEDMSKPPELSTSVVRPGSDR